MPRPRKKKVIGLILSLHKETWEQVEKLAGPGNLSNWIMQRVYAVIANGHIDSLLPIRATAGSMRSVYVEFSPMCVSAIDTALKRHRTEEGRKKKFTTRTMFIRSAIEWILK